MQQQTRNLWILFCKDHSFGIVVLHSFGVGTVNGSSSCFFSRYFCLVFPLLFVSWRISLTFRVRKNLWALRSFHGGGSLGPKIFLIRWPGFKVILSNYLPRVHTWFINPFWALFPLSSSFSRNIIHFDRYIELAQNTWKNRNNYHEVSVCLPPQKETDIARDLKKENRDKKQTSGHTR